MISGLGLLAALICLMLPAIWAWVSISLGAALVVAHGRGVDAAISESFQLTNPHFLKLLVFSLMLGFLQFLLSLGLTTLPLSLQVSELVVMPAWLWKGLTAVLAVASTWLRPPTRSLYGTMIGYPGKKLLFMGSEFGQWREWTEERALDWELLGSENHRNLLHWTSALLNLYRQTPCLYESDADPKGFRWLDCDDADHGLLVYLRETDSTPESLLFVCNFTPVVRHSRLQLPWAGDWELVLNSDDLQFGGSGIQPCAQVAPSEAFEYRGQSQSIEVTLPPLATFILKGSRPPEKPQSES